MKYYVWHFHLYEKIDNFDYKNSKTFWKIMLITYIISYIYLAIILFEINIYLGIIMSVLYTYSSSQLIPIYYYKAIGKEFIEKIKRSIDEIKTEAAITTKTIIGAKTNNEVKISFQKFEHSYELMVNKGYFDVNKISDDRFSRQELIDLISLENILDILNDKKEGTIILTCNQKTANTLIFDFFAKTYNVSNTQGYSRKFSYLKKGKITSVNENVIYGTKNRAKINTFILKLNEAIYK